ncbi:MAG: hypothetical protein AAF289_07925 [Cyanobacteria bacterium P01_A01_bin.135]
MTHLTDAKGQLVELDENTLVNTALPASHHAALRAGFAGYTANPRWSATKFRAWQVGRQWRQALYRGELVRGGDRRLVCASKN